MRRATWKIYKIAQVPGPEQQLSLTGITLPMAINLLQSFEQERTQS